MAYVDYLQMAVNGIEWGNPRPIIVVTNAGNKNR